MQTSRFHLTTFFLALIVACAQPTDDSTDSEKHLVPVSSHFEYVTANPLPEQHESKYVTDQSRWGQLVFDRTELENSSAFTDEHEMVANLIESYTSLWLDRNESELAQLLDENVTRLSGGRAAYGKADVVTQISQESRGERPEGFKSSMQLTIRDPRIRVNGDSASALYRIDIRGGARWEFADLATVLQVFRKAGDRWKLIGHTQSLRLGDSAAPPLPENVPTRIAPFRFDFVYPVQDLGRAVDFYTPLLGEPLALTATRASFRMRDSYFELEVSPIDERIKLKDGLANGYGIIDVESLEVITRRLSEISTINRNPTPCEQGKCVVTEDPSGNIVVWREREANDSSQAVIPTVSLGSGAKVDRALDQSLLMLMSAWMATDARGVTNMLTSDAVWVDDAMNVAIGAAQIKRALEDRWQSLDRGSDGVDGDMVIDNIRIQSSENRQLVTFESKLQMRHAGKSSFSSFILQVWSTVNGVRKLDQTFIARARDVKDVPVRGMDYTGYPVTDLGAAGRYYKIILESEPYRDNNWFGFWSTTSVFGLVGDYPDVESYSPVPHQSNGYADLSVRSVEEVYNYLESRGARFPHVHGINDTPGIDTQPGYKQVLAVDSEGNLINFSQYLEY